MISWAQLRWRFHYHLANLFLRLGHYGAAANAYSRALSIRPDDPHVQFQRAWSLLEAPRRRVEAITAFETLMKSSPSGFGYYLMACGLQRESRHEEAVRAFGESARLEPSESADFHYNHAISLGALGRLEEAADAYQEAARLSPSDAEAWGNLGAMFVELGRWKDAAPCQERAMRSALSSLRGLNLAETLYELNRLEEAERVLREALAIDRRSTDVKELLAMVLAGLDRYEEALTLAQELCAAKPVALSSRVVLAGMLMEAGRLEEAMQEATAAAEAAPSDPRPQIALGTIYLKMNNGGAALAAFERVQRFLDQSTERISASSRAWNVVGRGNALSLLGQHEEAMSAFGEALRIDPGFFERWPELSKHYDQSLREAGRR
jgi:tetratricopeptide (TPR) repeat protein